jgi:hypothetical protein
VAVVSRDRRMFAETAAALSAALSELAVDGAAGSFVVTQGMANVCRGRNEVATGLRRQLGRDRAWVLWVDDDILCTDGGPVAAAIRRAWDDGVGWTAHYRMADGRSHMMAGRGETVGEAPNFTQDQVLALHDWAPVGMCGLGFCYLPLDLTYVWRADTLGEDVRFFLDTQPDVRFAKGIETNGAVGVRHLKSVLL